MALGTASDGTKSQQEICLVDSIQAGGKVTRNMFHRGVGVGALMAGAAFVLGLLGGLPAAVSAGSLSYAKPYRVLDADNRVAVTAAYPDHPSVGFLEASFEDGARHACTGSLIAPDWVITAGHCVRRAQQGPAPAVPAGDASRDPRDARDAGWVSSLAFFPLQYRQDSRPHPRRLVDRVLLSKSYWQRITGQAFGIPQSVDFALLHLSKPVDFAPNIALEARAKGRTLSRDLAVDSFSYGRVRQDQALLRQEGCRLKRTATSVRHSCDSGGGSSGAALVTLSEPARSSASPRFALMGMHTGAVPGEDNVSARLDAESRQAILAAIKALSRGTLSGGTLSGGASATKAQRTAIANWFYSHNLNAQPYYAVELRNSCTRPLTVYLAERSADRSHYRVVGQKTVPAHGGLIDAFRSERRVIFLSARTEDGQAVPLGANLAGQANHQNTSGQSERLGLYRFALAGELGDDAVVQLTCGLR